MQKSADAFRTISEVADDLALPQHVLRFWETRFPQIRPLKRAGGRRYYRPNDVVLLKSIRQLLYDDGYTIKGVQRLLKEHGPRGLADAAPSLDFAQQGDVSVDPVEDRQAMPEVERELLPLPEDVSSLSLAHRDALIDAIVTIDECRRIFETLRRRTG